MISTPRVILGIVALASGSVCGVMSFIAGLEMMDKVNEKLPESDQFEQWGWYAEKTARVHREYKRLYPSGQLSRKVRLLGVVMLASLLTSAWSLGIFGR